MERIKPFDLDKALNGEPVILRSGKFAYIYAVIPNQFTKNTTYSLIGAVLYENGKIYNNMTTWTKQGYYLSDVEEDSLDIIGMK